MNQNVTGVWSFAADANPNLEFNNATQQWEVKDWKGRRRFFSKCRSACLDWEQQNLQPGQT
jgi:hypothetical protein